MECRVTGMGKAARRLART